MPVAARISTSAVPRQLCERFLREREPAVSVRFVAGDHQQVGGTGCGDIEQPAVFGLLLALVELVEKVVEPGSSAVESRRRHVPSSRSRHRLRASARRAESARDGRCPSGTNTTGKLQPLCAVDGHQANGFGGVDGGLALSHLQLPAAQVQVADELIERASVQRAGRARRACGYWRSSGRPPSAMPTEPRRKWCQSRGTGSQATECVDANARSSRSNEAAVFAAATLCL